MRFRFSIRSSLLALTAAGFFSLVLASAARGDAIAIGFAVGVASLAVLFVPAWLWYVLVKAAGELTSSSISPAESTEGSETRG